MKTKTATAPNRNTAKRLLVWAGIVAVILTIPVLGQWPWGSEDFIFGAVMLFGSATIYELATRNVSNRNHRMTIGGAIFVVLAFIWVLLATG